MERFSVQREMNGDSAAALGSLLASTHGFADRAGLDESQLQRLCIIVEELASNAFDHGKARHVTLSLEVMGGAIRISLRDDGGHFDLREYVPAERPPEETGGGAGIAMVSAWCDVLDYGSGRDGNHLDLVLRIAK